MRAWLLLLVVLGFSASCGGDQDSGGLRIFAAASLRDLLSATDTGGLRISTGGSGLVAEQLLAGAKADVFISAGEREVDRLVSAGLVRAEDVRPLLRNRLVVIARKGHAAAFEPLDLKRADRVSLAHPEAVPAGRYAKAWLQSLGLWATVEPRVVKGLDVRAALAAVASGGAQFGIVYASDAAQSDSVEVVYAVPEGEGPAIIYPGAPLAASEHFGEAQAYLEELADPDGPWADDVRELGFLAAD